MDDKTTQEHPSFGMIRAARVSGQKQLFGVDYPQGHFIHLEISTGSITRSLGSEWFYSNAAVVQVAMSEVQWARMIASMNTSGVPCTIARRWGPDGKYSMIEDPPQHMSDNVVQKAEMENLGADVSAGMNKAQSMVDEMMQPNAKISKSKIRELSGLLQTARQDIECNLPFYVKQAQEASEKAAEQGKAEVSAYADHVVSELGKDGLRQQLEGGGILLSLDHIS